MSRRSWEVELDPGCRDAGLADVGPFLVGEEVIVLEMLALAGAAREVEAVADHVFPRVDRRLQRTRGSPGHPRQFA